jgi:hypothetical protein
VLLTPVLLSPILVTPIRLLLADLPHLVLLVLVLLRRHTTSLVHGLIDHQLGACLGDTCSGAAYSGDIKTSIRASLWRPLNEVPCKQKI